MYIHVHVYMYTYMYMYIHVYMYTYMYMYMYTYMHKYMYRSVTDTRQSMQLALERRGEERRERKKQTYHTHRQHIVHTNNSFTSLENLYMYNNAVVAAPAQYCAAQPPRQHWYSTVPHSPRGSTGTVLCRTAPEAAQVQYCTAQPGSAWGGAN